MRSFDEFGFEKKSNSTEQNNNLTDDFVTRRKKTLEVNKAEEIKEDSPAETKEIALAEQESAMTVVSIKSTGRREITKHSAPKKSLLSSDNILEKKKKKLPVRTFVVFACVFALSFLIVNQYVMINEYSKGISSMKSTIKGLESDLEQCETELIRKNKDIEELAKENGMIDDKNGQYVEIPVNDTITVYETNEDAEESLASLVMSALGENILRAWNTLTGAE